MSTDQEAVKTLQLEEVVDIVKEMSEKVQKDFILLVQTYRVEYHHNAKHIVTETREFDRIDLKEFEPDNIIPATME